MKRPKVRSKCQTRREEHVVYIVVLLQLSLFEIIMLFLVFLPYLEISREIEKKVQFTHYDVRTYINTRDDSF